MKTDPELLKWAEDLQDPEDAVALSAEAVLARAATDERRERGEWVLQLGALVFAVLVLIVLVAKTRSPFFAALGAIVLPVLVALFGVTIYLRQETWGIRVASVKEHVALTVRRRLVSHRIVQVNRAAMALLSAAFFSWFPFLALSPAERFGAEPWRLVVGVTVSVFVFGGAWVGLGRVVRRTGAELARWQDVEASLDP